MIKSEFFPDKIYTDKQDLFKDIHANISDIVALKCAKVYKSCDKGISVVYHNLKFNEVVKSAGLDSNDYNVVVNTTNILDWHNDLHVPNIWRKTIMEQQGKNYLVMDHQLELGKVIAKKEHIKIHTMRIPFSAVGKGYAGITEALVYSFPKNKVINSAAKEWLESGDSIEASVRMQYVGVKLAMNSEDKDHAVYKSTYDSYISAIANKSDFDDLDHFWVVTEAKNVKESSLVLFGSNNSTGILNTAAVSTDTKYEPSVDTQRVKKQFINLNLY